MCTSQFSQTIYDGDASERFFWKKKIINNKQVPAAYCACIYVYNHQRQCQNFTQVDFGYSVGIVTSST